MLRLRQTLEQQFDIATLTEIENDIRLKEQQLAKLADSLSQVRRISLNQERAITDMSKEGECQEKLRAINDEVRKCKANIKAASDKAKEVERVNVE